MAQTEPRYGGGIKMDHKQTSPPGLLAGGLQEAVPGECQVKAEGKTKTPKEMTCLMQGEDKNETSRVAPETDTFPQHQESNASTGGLLHPDKTGWVQALSPNTELSGQGEKIKSPIVVNPPQDKKLANGEENHRNPGYTEAETSLSHLGTLLHIFEKLDINAKPKLYTKLSDAQIQCLPMYSQHIKQCKSLSWKIELPEKLTLEQDSACEEEENIVYCKNLFLKDRKGKFYLVIVEGSCTPDLKVLKNQLKANRNLSFADEESLATILGLKPGEVTPFAIMHQSANDVRVVFHESLSFVMESTVRMAFHPFSPLLQVELRFPELNSVISYLGKTLEILNSYEADTNCKGKESANISGIQKAQKVNVEKSGKSKSQNSKTGLKATKSKSKGKQERERIEVVESDMVSVESSEMSCSSGKSLANPGRQGLQEFFKLDLGPRPREEWTLQTYSGETNETNTQNESISMNIDTGARETSETNTNVVEVVSHQHEAVVEVVSHQQEAVVEVVSHQHEAVVEVEAPGGTHAVARQTLPTSARKGKGKLRSFIHKNTEMLGQDKSNYVSSSASTKLFVNELPVLADKVKEKENLYVLSPQTILPELEEFYHHLSQYKINFREVDLGLTSSKDVGPALGVRCFLFKDRLQNYFFVISHELYEPDFGRLKLAIHPRKAFDPCSGYDLMDILGVDMHHLTPFAVMNHRARRNKIQIFFTEKIISSSMIFCIQHPFASGRRLILSSCDLQRLLAEFSSQPVGVVPEKVWLKKYDIFARFVDHNKTTETRSNLNEGATQLSHRRKNPLGEDNRDLAHGNAGGIVPCGANNRFLQNRNSDSFTDESESSRKTTLFINLKRCFQMFFINIMSLADITLLRNSSTEVKVDGFSTGSSVDFDAQGTKNGSTSNKGSCKDESVERERSTYAQNDDTFGEDREQLNNQHKMQCSTKLLMSTFSQGSQEETDNTMKGKGKESMFATKEETWCVNQPEEEEEEEEEDFLDHGFEHKGFEVMTSDEQAEVSIESVKLHLEESQIMYHFSHKLDNESGYKDEDIAIAKDLNDSNSDEMRSQICCTQHVVDKSLSTHYIIVGRDLEHIPIKRFRRRFDITNRLRIINDCCSIARTEFSNPFSIFLSTNHCHQQEKHSGKDHPTIRFKLVLHTSVYMDPTMECVFALPPSHAGLSLCLSARELERYGQRVFMDVLYMP